MKRLLRRRCWICRLRLLAALLLLLSGWMAFRSTADHRRRMEGSSAPAQLANSP